MYYELILLGLISMAAPWLAKVAGYETGRKPFDLVGVGGIFFLLTAGVGIGVTHYVALEAIGKLLMPFGFIVGWLALFAGALLGVVDVIREPDHKLAHKRA